MAERTEIVVASAVRNPAKRVIGCWWEPQEGTHPKHHKIRLLTGPRKALRH